jgi:multidrug resistance efflux pump
VRLDPYDLHERLAAAGATLAAERATHDKLRAGFRPEEIEQARQRLARFRSTLQMLEAGMRPLEIQILEAKLDQALAELAWAQVEHARVKSLFERDEGAKNEYDNAVRRLEVATAAHAAARDELALAREGTRLEEIAQARANAAEAEAELKLLENGYRAEDIAEAAARVDAAEAQVRVIEAQVKELEIRSPGDAVVQAIDLDPGDLIAANAPVVTLMDLRRLWMRAYVPADRLGLREGQAVQLQVDAFPGRTLPARITFISALAEFTPANVQTPEDRVQQVFRIKVTLEPTDAPVRPGMTGDVLLGP